MPCFDGDTSNGCAEPQGIDEEVLEQRKAFLRPDSAVMVVVLSDENDCSIKQGGKNYLALQALRGSQQFFLPRATSTCDDDPSDPCCYSCGDETPAECTSSNPSHERDDDPSCQKNSGRYADTDEDNLNLRCWDQKRRYGTDFLYPVERYRRGLLDSTVETADGDEVPNPLYTNLQTGAPAARTSALVFLTGIVGVPWQDITTDHTSDRLRYLTTSELTELDRWSALVGDPTGHVAPSDPHMVESTEPRSGQNPIIGATLETDMDSKPTANAINGHEYDTDNGVKFPWSGGQCLRLTMLLDSGGSRFPHGLARRIPERNAA